MTKQMALKKMIAPAIAAVALTAGGLAVAQTGTAGSEPTLRERVLQPTELRNFGTVLCPSVVEDAGRWASRYASTGSLQANQFVSGLSEPLYSVSLRAQAVTSVAEFGSAGGARAEAERELSAAGRAPGRFSEFPVAGIPGAHGFTIDRGTVIERDVVFTAGRYLYLVGVTYRVGSSTPVPTAWLTGAALDLYQRA
jgi:hypothetical protein